ncbi:MAG TPA: hypothetical protein VLV15_09465 [Dongiaceae bacterium]|nr:hypothetical protein [Dongiaceae bacterium]
MSELEDQIEEWFARPPPLGPHASRRNLALGVAVAGLLAGAGAGLAFELSRAPPAPTRPTVQPLLRLDPLYVFAPRETPQVISAQK